MSDMEKNLPEFGESKYVPSKEVSCNGNNSGLGHPKVYLNMGTKDYVVCPYCSQKFIYQK